MKVIVNFPPKEIITPVIGTPNFELIILWMLSNNERCSWSDLKKMLTPSTLSLYLRKLINKGLVFKRKHNEYIITAKGTKKFLTLSQEKEVVRKIVFPPEVILKRRNYRNWILWVLYNNYSCLWRDFQEEPLAINQSSLSKNLNLLLDSGFIKKEGKEYKITTLGKNEYVKVLRTYNLDRQSILEEESKRIEGLTKRTIEFFEKFNVSDRLIHYRFLQYAIRLDYSKLKTILEEVDFQKILLFFSINHPDQYPKFISKKDFSMTYGIDELTLEYYIAQIVENQLYPVKFFTLEKSENQIYYFLFDESLERMLRVIVEQIITRDLYLNKLYFNTNYKAPILSLNSLIVKILEKVNNDILSSKLKESLRKLLPDYIRYLAFKIEKETKLIDEFDKLEGIIWQNISEAIESGSSELKNKQIYGNSETNYLLDPTILKIAINFVENTVASQLIEKLYNKEYDSAEELLDLKLKEEGTNVNLKLYRALLSCFLNKYSDGLVNLDINLPPTKKREQVEFFQINALLYSFSNLSLGNFENALKMSETVISNYPEYSLSSLIKGMTLGYNILYNSITDQTVKKEMFVLLEKAIELERNSNFKACFLHLESYFLMCFNEYSTALILIEKAIVLQPQTFEMYYLKIEILKYLNQHSKIFSLLDELLDKFPEKEKVLKLIKAHIFKISNKIEEALEIMEDLLIRFPEDNDLLINKIYYLQYLNKDRESIKMVKKLINENQTNGIFHDIYGELLMYSEHYEYATEEIQKAIEIDPLRWYTYQSYIKLGVCYKELGRYELALKNLTKGKELTNRLFCDYQSKQKWLIIADLFINEINFLLED